jgi:hypothetical protein
MNQFAPATRNVTLTNMFRLPVLTEEAEAKQIYDWLSSWGLGPGDTRWRFFNTLSDNDQVNISKGTFYVGKRPGDSSRTGYLCVYPPLKCVIYAEHEKRPKFHYPRIFLLHIRVDPYLWLSPGIIYAATLSATEKTIHVEDLLMYNGINYFTTKKFSERWLTLQNSLHEDLFLDEELQSGLQMKLRDIRPLNAIQPVGVWDIIPEEAGRRRYLWIGGNKRKNVVSNYSSVDVPSSSVPIVTAAASSSSSLASNTMMAMKGAFPDQYFLTQANQKKGMAIIRDHEISKNLKQATKTSSEVRVRVCLSPEFDGSYEIMEILS